MTTENKKFTMEDVTRKLDEEVTKEFRHVGKVTYSTLHQRREDGRVAELFMKVEMGGGVSCEGSIELIGSEDGLQVGLECYSLKVAWDSELEAVRELVVHTLVGELSRDLFQKTSRRGGLITRFDATDLKYIKDWVYVELSAYGAPEPRIDGGGKLEEVRIFEYLTSALSFILVRKTVDIEKFHASRIDDNSWKITVERVEDSDYGFDYVLNGFFEWDSKSGSQATYSMYPLDWEEIFLPGDDMREVAASLVTAVYKDIFLTVKEKDDGERHFPRHTFTDI